MRLTPARHRFGVIFGALLFVLAQALTATTASAHAGRPVLDAFGNPLCVNDLVETDGGNGAAGHGVPDCCLYGDCHMACHTGVTALLLPDAIVMAWRPAETGHAVAPLLLRNADEKTGHRPGRPRAPPFSA